MRGIDGLASVLESLPLVINGVDVSSSRVLLAGYADGPRPTSTVALEGRGERGCGEHVGWSDEAHRFFAKACREVPRGEWKLGSWSQALRDLPAYDRAALEAAALDLALRQNGASLFSLAGIEPRPVRYVVSLARVADPVAEAGAASGLHVGWKLDVDPGWPDAVWSELAASGRVEVLDFKFGGDAGDAERAAGFVATAWLEDPVPVGAAWSADVLARLSADAPVTSVALLEALEPRPRAVNVKPARMGGVLEAISCLARARALGLEIYVGGMFEVGVGRRQLLELAALACPDGPNDIALLVGEGPRLSRLAVEGIVAGFGGGSRA